MKLERLFKISPCVVTHTVEVPEVGPQRKKVCYVRDVREDERGRERKLQRFDREKEEKGGREEALRP